MLSIKTMLKIKSYKKKFSSFLHILATPLNFLGDFILNSERRKYERKQIEISKWTDEYAIALYCKIFIKRMIKYNENHEEFVVAGWCNNDYGWKHIRDFITDQNKNDDLKSWGYKISFEDVKRIEGLTELFKLELEKHEEITCKYIVEEDEYKCSNYSNGYIKTLIVEINKGDK